MEQDIAALVEMDPEDEAEAEEDDEPEILEELEDQLHHTSILIVSSGHQRAVSQTGLQLGHHTMGSIMYCMTAFSIFLTVIGCKHGHWAASDC